MNIIEAQEKYLSFKGDQYYALDLINSLRESYGSKDMPKMLNDFVFNLEVALQNAGVLDQDFNLIEEEDTGLHEVECLKCEHVWTEVIYFKVCPKCGNDDVMQTIYLQKGEE